METYHPHVPPIIIVQIQIPSEPPPSMFTSVEDGPGWAILMFFKITKVTVNFLGRLRMCNGYMMMLVGYGGTIEIDDYSFPCYQVICGILREGRT